MPNGDTATPQKTTLTVAVRRVVLDITVTDNQGKPVRGLTQADFHVFEDGVPQNLRSFEAHTTDTQPPLELPKLPAHTFSNFASAPGSGPTTVVLYDLLNTPLNSQPYARAQLLDFLKQRKISGQVAVFVLSDRLHLLQGFTEDENALIAALNLQKNARSNLLQDAGETSAASDQLARTDGNQNGADARTDVSFQTISGMLKNMETIESSYELDRRVDITAEALQQIARFLIALPGRKSLLWLSASFPNGIIPDADVNGRDPATGRNEFSATRNYSADIQAATNLLNASHVAVYPIDVRGLQANPMFSAASNQTFEPGQRKDSRAVRSFQTQLASEHATMDTIGDQTGGHAFYNTNGLKEAAAQAIEQSSLYYTVSYTPSNRSTGNTLRRIRVELARPGFELAYRRSYFANIAASTPDDADSADPLAATLQHGAPAAHEIFFEAHLDAVGAPVAATPDQMAELMKHDSLSTRNRHTKEPELKSVVMMQRYLIEYALLPRQLTLTLGPDQARRDHLEFSAVSFDAEGSMLDGTRTEIQDVIRPDRWNEILQAGGYHVPMAVMLPVQSASLRLAVRDLADGHLGSLELNLPLLPDAASATPSSPTQ